MTDPRNAEAAAMRLAELSHEVEELEDSRAALLKRVDRIRATLITAGNRAMTMRASIDLLCEHLTNMVTTMAELHALEQEIQEVGRGIEENEKDSSMLSFEADSFQEMLDEAEEELERLSSLLQGKARHTRGH
jgi:chromosome segregation ATPase